MEQPTSKDHWYYELWSVFVALILIGPLAFPLLWKSPKFSLSWKWGLTLVFTLLTFVMVWMTWATIEFLLDILRAQGLI